MEALRVCQLTQELVAVFEMIYLGSRAHTRMQRNNMLKKYYSEREYIQQCNVINKQRAKDYIDDRKKPWGRAGARKVRGGCG